MVSIDVENKRNCDGVPNTLNTWDEVENDRITWIVRSSTDPATVREVGAMAAACGGPVMVSLDSDHREAHVAQELEFYAPMVTHGSYLVVEDTNISGRPMTANDPGPGAAADAFLEAHPEFRPNLLCERNILTMHPGGWLWRTQ